MANDAHPLPMRLGEVRPYYGSATAPTGSTLTSAGASTVTLYDASGAVAGGISATAVTGEETGAQNELLAWYTLNPSSPPGGTALMPGVYELVFSITATGSDGIVRTFKPSVMVVLKAAADD